MATQSTTSMLKSQKQLPNLYTREAIQGYLLDLAQEMGVSLDDVQIAAELDRRDKLAAFRSKFYMPTIGEICEEDKRAKGVNLELECIYMCGHSLGLQPKGGMELVRGEMEKWASTGVRSYFEGQFPLYCIEKFFVDDIAKIVGAKPLEVTVMNSSTINSHLGMVPFYQPTKDRHKILIESQCFSSKFFVVQSQIRLHGYDPESAILEVIPRENESVWRNEDILTMIAEQGDSIALVYLSGVHYATGHLFDMKSITEAAHKKGCYVGFDLAHATGNVELHLHDWNVDYAAWCSYKYLNSGPGSLAGFFVHERHANNFSLPRFIGWWGHEISTRLKMSHKLELQSGAAGFQISNPPVLQCMLLRASLDVFGQTSMVELSAKSRILTSYLELLIEQNLIKSKACGDRYVDILTSSDPTQRGCQLSVSFSWSLDKADEFLTSMGAVCEFSPPSILQIAPTPLYNTFNDILRLYQLLKRATLYNV